ncbi:hypothetical protein EDB84DRAFT_1560956 [Lactarius hengduanensis]|nr:hypothetical protein EDB84DRAFT_1560956 [Lactarius hengduanensis]
MFSLAQPSNNKAVDGLPVVQLSDDAGLVRALITALYPIPFEIPASYDRILALLAAAQKYDMGTVFSSIRSEVFRAYAIASNSMLIPEMEMAARLSLGLSMTFEDLGVELRLFEGGALRALVPSCQRHSKPHHCPSPAPLDAATHTGPRFINPSTWTLGSPADLRSPVDQAADARSSHLVLASTLRYFYRLILARLH